MAADPMARAIERTRRAVLRLDGATLTDGQLLGSFLSQRDEAAFEALMRRHGPMVLGVCRRVVGNLHDAEDAFQATFLVLALKAATVVPREAVGNWLYGVAYRTALKARGAAARRRARERQVREMPQPPVLPAEGGQELELLLDQHLNALPEKYRLPIVLCDLEGRTRREVARQLGVADGTLSNRLAAGRRLLARRLARHGLAVAGGASAALIPGAAASPLPALLAGTVKAAKLLVAGSGIASVVTAEVADLIQGELRSMLLTKLKLATGLLLVATLAGFALPGAPTAPPPAPAKGAAAKKPAEAPIKRFPVWANAKAFVQRDERAGLRLRAEIPMGRFITLLDADGNKAHVHEFAPWQPPPFTVNLQDVRVYDTRGRAKNTKDWAKGLTGETLVLMEFRDGQIAAEQMAEAFRLYREDLAVLILPPKVFLGLDRSKAFSPAKSLPQVFPGAQRAPGDPTPPPKRNDR